MQRKYQLGRKDTVYVNHMAPKIRCLAVAGAGMKGMGEAGALEGMEAGWPGFVAQLRYVIGSSAGASIVALVAAGAPPEKLKKYVKETDFREFKDITAEPSNSKAKKFFRGCANIFSKQHGLYNGEAILKNMRKWIHDEIHQNLLAQLNKTSPWQARQKIQYLKKIGLIKSAVENERGKLNFIKDIQLTDRITFRHLNELAIFYPDVFKKLFITGTNYTKKRLEVFCNKSDPEMEIALAVRISMSIPWVFKMVKYKDDSFMDGGCLNNFAIDHFDAPEFMESENCRGLQGQNLSAVGIKMASGQEKKEEGQKPKPVTSKLKRAGNAIAKSVANKLVGVKYKESCEKTRAVIEDHAHRVVRVFDEGVGMAEFGITDAKLEKLHHSGYGVAAPDFIKSYKGAVTKVEKSSVQELAAKHPERLQEFQYQLKKCSSKEMLGKVSSASEDEARVNTMLTDVTAALYSKNVPTLFRFHGHVKKVQGELPKQVVRFHKRK